MDRSQIRSVHTDYYCRGVHGSGKQQFFLKNLKEMGDCILYVSKVIEVTEVQSRFLEDSGYAAVLGNDGTIPEVKEE